MEQSLQPVSSKQRIAIIDMLRGWALLGVVLMNYSDYFLLAGLPARFRISICLLWRQLSYQKYLPLKRRAD